MLEFGPAVVRRAGGGQAPADTAAIALEGADDRVVLVEDRPARVDDLWRGLIARTLGERCDHLLVVHPSSWPATRVARVVRAASASADRVESASRAERAGAEAVVVEIDARVVMVCADGILTAVARDDAAAIATAVARHAADQRPVVIDVPPGLHGAEVTAAIIRAALSERGLVTTENGFAAERPASRRRIRLEPRLIGAVAVAFVSLIAVFIAIRPHRTSPVPSASPPVLTSTVVEGRVAVVVPEGWTVERLTSGVGSRRVRVGPPGDPDRALHITQAYAPGTTVADAGVVLGRVVAAQSAGVFTDFRPDDRVGGRAAVTYRENRPPRVTRWAVLLDGSTRIGIGCQSRAGVEVTVDEACEQAIRSARELGGTVGRS